MSALECSVATVTVEGTATAGTGLAGTGLAGTGDQRPALGVGMVGYAFMGAAHSHAWRTAAHVFDLPLRPSMVALCGRDADAARAAARRLGWAAAETDWRALISRDDVQLVDICAPGDLHAQIAIAALDAGKHVLCEKPLASTEAEADAMAAAAARASARGVRSMTGFNYRRVPALALARRLVRDGRIGRLRHVRASYLQDWLVDPAFPLTWRLQREQAGSGALGDLGSHIVDLAQYLTGDLITGVSAVAATFVGERPLPGARAPAGTAPGAGAQAGAPRTGPVTVDDAVLFTARLGSQAHGGGALASFEATRFASGRKNELRIELNGDRGSLAFNLERLNELQFYDHTQDAASAGFQTILVTEPGHPYLSGWWPPGHVLGWDATFTHEIADLVTDIAKGADPTPSFADGLQVQRVLAAVERSAARDSRWTPVPPPAT
ncbi:MAG TPA: Gfo/Idh/MocA family oxidoreductase [Streptosporangiaceae bacterium]|nr:Gfo/Idh/MocA family oxidoreductase [Streptosporangiaceae bacterium]